MTEAEKYMSQALELTDLALELEEAPIGCVIVYNGEIVGRGYNRRETDQDALAHAEILAIEDACKNVGSWRLVDCDMYVTLEPCPMCAGAIINSRIRKVYFGAYDKKAGSCGSVVNLFELPYNHKPEIQGGVLENECAEKLTSFFRNLRENKKKTE